MSQGKLVIFICFFCVLVLLIIFSIDSFDEEEPISLGEAIQDSLTKNGLVLSMNKM